MADTDPPWLYEAGEHGRNAIYFESGRLPPAYINWPAVARAVLAFAARQPRPITDAEVDAAYSALIDRGYDRTWEVEPEDVRAQLEAAEKARRDVSNLNNP